MRGLIALRFLRQSLIYSNIPGGTEKRSHALSLAERKVIAYHESGHALVGWMLPNSDILLKVTIVPRTSLALGFAQYTPSEQHLYSKEELFDKMCMALGGRAAENLVFNRITTGAQNDLEKVTKIAYSQIKKFGMSKSLGPIYVRDADETESGGAMGSGGKKPFSRAMETMIDNEARHVVASAYQTTEGILTANRDKLEKVSPSRGINPMKVSPDNVPSSLSFLVKLSLHLTWNWLHYLDLCSVRSIFCILSCLFALCLSSLIEIDELLKLTLSSCFSFQLAEALLEKETLDYDQVVELIGPPPHELGKRQVDAVEFEQSLKNLGNTDPDPAKV